MARLTKEKKLYILHGRKWDVLIKYKIGIYYNDSINIVECTEKMIDLDCVLMKRITIKIKLFNGYSLYLNKLYGGSDKNDR